MMGTETYCHFAEDDCERLAEILQRVGRDAALILMENAELESIRKGQQARIKALEDVCSGQVVDIEQLKSKLQEASDFIYVMQKDTAEVESLRAQVADLQARLASATLLARKFRAKAVAFSRRYMAERKKNAETS